ncbi:MAG: VanZ family protein [Gammaproteobacteria bacterium]
MRVPLRARFALFWLLLLGCSVLALIPQPPSGVASTSDVLLHLGAFFTLTCSLAAARPAAPAWQTGPWLVGYGALIELLQGASGWRHAEWGDFGVDVVGVALGLAAWACVRSR